MPLSMSSIVSGILSPTIFVLFAMYLFVFILHKRLWKLVCLPFFAPVQCLGYAYYCFVCTCLFLFYSNQRVLKDRSFTRTLVLLCYPGLCIICVVAMSRKENLISELHTRKGTWKIVVRITNLWEVRKQNSKQAIKMVLMDQTVIVAFFLFVVISHFYCI